MPEFERIAIVNRGEAAVRLIRGVAELRREGDAGLRTLALYTEPDRGAVFVREADEAYPLGSATFVDPADGRRKNRYLDYATLEKTLRASRAEAVWVGWGFVAEHAAFAELCSRLGVVFIGPDPDVMRALGDKIGSKRMAEKAGVPVAPWSGGPVESLADAREQAGHLGFPLMVKATAGGGGRGIRRVRSLAELDEAFESARSEALAGFGDDTVFMERLVEGARHIEVQIVGDGETTWALGVRDCTVQRRNQKVIEESPSCALSEAQHREICDAAARLGTLAGYRNAGTVEFLYDPVDAVFSFMEVNARLQVEHPVTEATTGADLIKLQIHVARGGRLEGSPPPPRGHAIEVRVNAEDPERGFAPTPGTIELLRLPGGPGLRVDSGFVEGDRVAPEFDSMLAKVIAHGRTRAEALARLQRGLRSMQLAVRGGASNKGFLLGLLEAPEVQSGEVDVGWLDRVTIEGRHLSRRHADVALVQAAIDCYNATRAAALAQFRATAARGRLRPPRDVGYDIELRQGSTRYELRVFRVAHHTWRVEMDGVRLDVEVEKTGELERRLRIGDRTFQTLRFEQETEQVVEVDGIPHRFSRDDVGSVRSPAPAVVLSLSVSEGDVVETGDRLAVLEAMKTELPVTAPCSGRVRQVLVSSSVQVEAGQALLLIEPAREEQDATHDERISLAALRGAAPPSQAPGDRLPHTLEELRRFSLGYDLDAASVKQLVAEHSRAMSELPDPPEGILAQEEQILAVFADQSALLERGRGGTGRPVGDVRTPEEYLLLYLRSLDPAAAGLSPGYVDRLQRALRHYEVDDLARTPELEEALLRICQAHERLDEQAGVVLGILEQRLERAEPASPSSGAGQRELLERVAAAAGSRHQAVADLAREVRYRVFDRPFFASIRDAVHADAERHLQEAVRASTAEARERAIRALVECPQPLAPLLSPRFDTADAPLREVMLETLMRRYYRIRTLEDVSTREHAGRSFAFAAYPHEGRRIDAVITHAAWKDLTGLGPVLPDLVAALPSERDVVIDLYVWRDGADDDPDAESEELRTLLTGWSFPRPIRRVVVAIASPGRRGMGGMRHFTFRTDDGGGFREDVLMRGLHPMMAKRLQLWRLDNFEIERIPSIEDIYLFRGVARSNPRDERLFAFAEVRDLTPVRDEHGRVHRLPHLEMQYHEALGAIRRFQSRRSSRRRLQWNRVLLYVWPPLELETDEIREIAHRLIPAIDGLGMQKTVVRARLRGAAGELEDTVLQIASPDGREAVLSFTPPAERPIAPLSAYAQKVVRMRQRGMPYPYELVAMLAPARDGARTDFPPGEFQEYDLDEQQRLVPVDRPPGENTANLVVGVIRSFTSKHPEGMTRVALLGDGSREMGSFAEPECRRIIGALELARELDVPLEWFALSAGAKIAMDSGTENLDWTALALRRIVEFTQEGGEIHVIVCGVNVGGQSYWNAEATMLMHTRGILVMTPDASMVLTGKRALDYSGGVSAEDNQGIGGYDKIMGVNGEAQYWAPDLADACRLLYRYYEHAYRAPGEPGPRRAPTDDPFDRDVCSYPYAAPGDGGDTGAHGFETIGDIWSPERNPGRRKPFAIRRVLGAVVDQDHAPLERWADMREAEIAVVWDAHMGGIPTTLIGLESKPVPRLGFVAADGPEQWTGGTLFPLSSKKVARAINASSGSRPVVVLANLSGFDGSPESLRRLQLEYGAEIGRAVVNFRGTMVFCVISRYHGGAYVVFSRQLNAGLEVAALEGSYASVIGGAPAAAVVFSGEVDRLTREDPRLQALEAEIAEADESARGRLRARWHALHDSVRSEKLGEVADHFDRVHSIERARDVGSLDQILPPTRLRPYLIDALERGLARNTAT